MTTFLPTLNPLRSAALLVAGLASALALGTAAPAGANALPTHDSGRVQCGANAVSGMPEVATTGPDVFFGTSLKSEQVAWRPVLYRWNGTTWVLHRIGEWRYAEMSSGGNPVGAPQWTLFGSQTFSPLEHGYYAVLNQFWWSSNGAGDNVFANEYGTGYASYCGL